MRVGIATVYTPGIAGGAELHAQGLSDALHAAGHLVHHLRMPFTYWPAAEIGRSMDAWASMDFTRYGGGQIDKIICLKFPTYLLDHPNKAVWLLHQHRAAYELYGTPMGFEDRPENAALRDRIIAADTAALGAVTPVWTNSQRVSERLHKYNGIASAPLYHPPHGAEQFRCEAALPYIFYPSRLETLKRQHLLIEAIAQCNSPVGAVLSGEGGTRAELERLIEQYDLGNRVRLVGHITRDQLLDLYANALGVFFGPFDEDYGYITLEAMLSAKPVITCTDSGGPLEFVRDGQTGFVVPPDAPAIAAAIAALAGNPAQAQAMGAAGRNAYDAAGISWTKVVETLTGDQKP
ncbi:MULTISPECIES: glycosyltransferase [unclassified Devosia]|uniref:glycosyltransferase n=1 Tax=unclassified Devosia TaxID=196773 RepID=UPI001551B631|nr:MULTISPECIES: glycosyltransferase [unclassified Devosia]